MIKKIVLASVAIATIANSASFVSVASQDKQNNLNLLGEAGKERLLVRKWTKNTKDEYRQHKHLSYTLHILSQLFLIEI
ncbi:MAG TPA: hypothetical protein ENN12_04860 [Epsilonproteobacteria bacterium]|nr:hypothetical protein [Campylobacterota bacterium]